MAWLDISPRDVKALLDSSKTLRLIDCREPDEFAIGHIEGAELLPLSNFPAETAAKLAQKEQAILIYCHHGGRSARAAEYLVSLGFKDVRNLTGGIDAWSVEIDPRVPRY